MKGIICFRSGSLIRMPLYGFGSAAAYPEGGGAKGELLPPWNSIKRRVKRGHPRGEVGNGKKEGEIEKILLICHILCIF